MNGPEYDDVDLTYADPLVILRAALQEIKRLHEWGRMGIAGFDRQDGRVLIQEDGVTVLSDDSIAMMRAHVDDLASVNHALSKVIVFLTIESEADDPEPDED